jgi:hypothetical protein
MGAFSSKGLKVYISTGGTGAPAPVTITNVTNAKPAIVTVGSADIDSFAQGDLVLVNGTGIPALDGGYFPVGTIDDVAFTFPLVGSDGTGATGPSTTGTVTNYEANMLEFCVATMEYALTPGQAINVGTTCDPSATLAGEPQAGTLSITGFTDLLSPGYLEFMDALKDGQPRVIEVAYPPAANPPNGATMIYPSATASGYTQSIGVGQAVAFTGEFTLGTNPVLRK